MKIAIVGNCPSVGSSFLADLLDSTEYSACGDEMNFFSNKKIYDFQKFKKHIGVSSLASGVHRIRNRLNFHHLHLYGLNKIMFAEIVKASPDLINFVDQFAIRFMALRSKRVDGIFFEKTPENINCIKEFLETFSDSYFIHITRNPLYIYPSLMKRDFPKYIALISWLIDVAKYFKYKDHKRVLTIRYEDLIKTPFTIVKNILEKITNIRPISEESIRFGFTNNKYRQLFTPRIKTWEVTDYGSIINANIDKKLSDHFLKDLASLLNVKVSCRYAKLFDIADISFIDALKELGYYEDFMGRLNKFDTQRKLPQKTFNDYLRLILKWEEDFRHGDVNWTNFKTYLNPIERV